jgi:hypothetical protein
MDLNLDLEDFKFHDKFLNLIWESLIKDLKLLKEK